MNVDSNKTTKLFSVSNKLEFPFKYQQSSSSITTENFDNGKEHIGKGIFFNKDNDHGRSTLWIWVHKMGSKRYLVS